MLGVDGLDKESDGEYGRVHSASPEEGTGDPPPSVEEAGVGLAVFD